MSAPVDLELRVVRYFVAVAEHGHFGRAAAALHITQPSLSRQIRGLERQLGTTLLLRTPRGSQLTDAGRAFLTHAEPMLAAAVRAAAHARAAAVPRRLTVGYTTNLVVGAAVRELRRRLPDVDVTVRHLPWNGAQPALTDRTVDVAVTRLPIPLDGVEVTPLYREPRALLVARGHRMAAREAVELADIEGEVMPRVSDPMWDSWWRTGPRPDGWDAPDGPVLDDAAEMFDFIVETGAVLIVPADSRIPDLNPELTTVPLLGVEPGEVALARRAGEPNVLVDEFASCAAEFVTPGTPSPRRR
ncbi:LysR family transcriptional regulator [Mycobacterium yunnanensis]|uniref:LysR family transcriptional regulator n=1 Tax=Mycobacterium yunnanensis TaxID=368477 RepID=UPI0021F2AB30|nr:LysR family transcriptional regulator [Mycobacterium yunnanensis]